MNYANVSILVNGCTKLDRLFRKTLFDYYIRHNVRNQSKSSIVRIFHNFHNYRQAQQDKTVILPSPQEVNAILQESEYTKELSLGPVKSFDTNCLPSNNPMEDAHASARTTYNPGYLFGVFDGHSGRSCAEVASLRLFDYIAASLLSLQELRRLIRGKDKLIEKFHESGGIIQLISPNAYVDRFNDFVKKLFKERKNNTPDIKTCLEKSFLQLDSDISTEALQFHLDNPLTQGLFLKTALSGACACVAYIDGPHLYVANLGDCRAVLGQLSEENQWICKTLTTEHNFDNNEEVSRIINEHPNEKNTVLMQGRLLGMLAPFRTLGDFMFKWPMEVLDSIRQKYNIFIPPNYHSPPYLTARPEVQYHRLTPKDKFLILATDGIWDTMTPLQAVNLIGGHVEGKVFYNPLVLPSKNNTLGEVNATLIQRRKNIGRKPEDKNAATHIIRHALGGTDDVDQERLSSLLSKVPGFSRQYRDDMTVTIVHFDSDFISKCPA